MRVDPPGTVPLSPRAASGAQAVEPALALPPSEFLSDLQSLLAAAVKRLVETTGCTLGAAWALRPDGAPYVAAASMEGVAPIAPSAECFAALAQLAGASDLGRCGEESASRAVAIDHGFSAVACVGSPGAPPVALLLVGGREDPPGAVRPRTLAALAAAARRLEGPGAAAAALSRLERLDEEVRRLDRLAALGDLVAEVVHEVRNPLVSVKTFLQLLPQRIEEPEFRVRFFDVVTSELRRIERLLDVVLDQARPRAAQAPDASTQVGPVLASVARLLTHRALERGIQIEAETAESLPPARVGEDRLRQVVLNLALNAIDATPQGGRVRLTARRDEAGVEVLVEDQGPGVPPELRLRIFEPFFSTKGDRPGGLGLTISRRIVEESGGSVAVDERPGGGAIFRVRLQRGV